MKKKLQRISEEFRHEFIKFYKKSKQKKPIVPKHRSGRMKHNKLLVKEFESKVSIFFFHLLLGNNENDSFFEKVDLFLA